MPKGGLIRLIGQSNTRNYLLWYNDEMNRCLWFDVMNGDTEIVFMLDISRDFPVNDFAEDGFFRHDSFVDLIKKESESDL